MVVIDGDIPRGEHKLPMPTLTCGECKHMLVGIDDNYIKILPEDYLKNWDCHNTKTKITRVFTCPNCKHEAIWEKGTKQLNNAILRQKRMERRGWCTGLQRKYR